MAVPTLMYHDVTAPGHPEESGFTGAGPDLYKLDWERFDAHLDALARYGRAPVTHDSKHGVGDWILTFDDGGACSAAVAEAVAARGWVAHFFVPSATIGTERFATADELRAIVALGHVVGSHSHTHPIPVSGLTPAQVSREWSESTQLLSELLGTPVTAASVPGGYTSSDVERSAVAAGIQTLFTSQPTTRVRTVDGGTVSGRYAIRSTTSSAAVLALITGRGLERRRQSASWAVKGVSKRVLGGAYPRIREALLSRRRS
jgi:peptidoglycan/xylan/chitin deacetylase (PgdA/CDA1 family)